MKKVLFASTALIATASVAAADVKFSGYGRFGIGYQEDRVGDVPNFTVDQATGEVSRDGDATVDTDNTILVSRFRLNIDGTAETDGGVEFSARVRLQADEDSGNGEANEAGLNGARFSVIYGGLRVDAGNVAGSFDNLANYYGNEPGLESFIGQYSGVDYSFLGYSSTGSGANAVFFQYAVGDFAFGASYDQATVALDGVPQDADRWDISATYNFNNITAALAYGQTKANVNSSSEKQSLTVLTLGGEWGNFSGTVFVADDDVVNADENGTAYGLSLAYTFGAATTITFAYGDGSADDDTRNLGIGAIYDLGGGASLRGGVGEAKTGDQDGSIRADFGAQFNF
ncbi:porin [Ruegeria atlantica]|uniref:Porin n=1 Tax=Ruegeria atlantica TaxID=81569 RepID=A0A0P1E2Q9_9RHOB|nr:porin [Ruegeria atlantica]CUH42504.1 Porin [Ruegeria atlantica]